MKLCNIGHNFDYELEKLIRLFLPFEKIEVLHSNENGDNCAVCEIAEIGGEIFATATLNLNAICRAFFCGRQNCRRYKKGKSARDSTAVVLLLL